MRRWPISCSLPRPTDLVRCYARLPKGHRESCRFVRSSTSEPVIGLHHRSCQSVVLFKVGEPRCAAGAGNPARYRRFVVVDNGKVETLLAVSATPARTHAVLALLRFKLRTSEQNKTGRQKNIETFYVEFLPRPCRWGLSGAGIRDRVYRDQRIHEVIVEQPSHSASGGTSRGDPMQNLSIQRSMER